MSTHVQGLLATVGIPACGKSTWTKRFMECWPDKYIQVERDLIRAEHFTESGNIWDYKFTNAKEKRVTEMQISGIRGALVHGKSVIVSDTNLNVKARNGLEAIGKEFGIEVEFHPIVEDLYVCMRRNSKRPNHVPEAVMINMQKNMRDYVGKYVQTQKMRENSRFPSCVIMDIDGTLADMKGVRGPFEWDKVHLDAPIKFVVDYAKWIYHDTAHDLILFSGRDGSCRQRTHQWLELQGVSHNGLFMRAAGSTINDSIVKERLFMDHVEPRYEVNHIVDDRKQVCVHWESMGFRVMNVGGFQSDF